MLLRTLSKFFLNTGSCGTSTTNVGSLFLLFSSSGCIQVFKYILYTVELRTAHSIQGEAAPTLSAAGDAPLDQLAVLCLMHPKMHFAPRLPDTAAHAKPAVTCTSRSLFAELLSSHFSSSLCSCLALLCPRCSTCICSTSYRC